MPSSRNHSRNGTSSMANSRRSGSTQASFSWITKTRGVPALAKRCAFIELLGSGSDECTALNIRANATNKKTWNQGARTSLRQALEARKPMSALGQKQKCAAKGHVRFASISDRKSELPHKVMSTLPPKADMCDATRDVRYGP